MEFYPGLSAFVWCVLPDARLMPQSNRSSVYGLAQDASIYADVQATGETVSCIRIGYYMPRGAVRLPVFFGMATYDGEIDAVINYLLSHDEPTIMLLPSIEDVPQAKINAIKSKGFAVLGYRACRARPGMEPLERPHLLGFFADA